MLQLLLATALASSLPWPAEEVPFPDDPARVDALNAQVVDAPASSGTWRRVDRTQTWELDIAPDGDRVVFAGRGLDVWSVREDRFVARWATDLGCTSPRWSGDGRHVAAVCAAWDRYDGPLLSVVWSVDTGQIVSQTRPSPGPWVAGAQAWLSSRHTRRAGNVGVWLDVDGTTRRVRRTPAPHILAPGHRVQLTRWSAVRDLGVDLLERQGHDPLFAAVELDRRGGLAYRHGAWLAPPAPWSVLPDGRLLATPPDAPSVWSRDGARLWGGEGAAPLSALDLAIATRTGRCPVDRTPHVDARGGVRVSPDGAWAITGDAVYAADGTVARRLPGHDDAPTAADARHLDDGSIPLQLGDEVVVVDPAAGRIGAALGVGTLVTASGDALLMLDADGLLRVDMTSHRAWRVIAQDVLIHSGRAWVADERRVAVLDPDGYTRHAITAPAAFGPRSAHMFDIDDLERSAPVVQSGWGVWPFHDGRIVARLDQPSQAWALRDEEVARVRLLPHPEGFCGLVSTTELLGWSTPDAVHVLDGAGRTWVLPRTTDNAAPPTVRTAMSRRVDRAVRASAAGEISAWGQDADGGNVQLGRWAAPEGFDMIAQPPAAPDAASAPTVAYALDDEGWAVVRSDGSAAGRDPRGGLVRDPVGGGAPEAPLHVSQRWSPEPPRLGPCPWDE